MCQIRLVWEDFKQVIEFRWSPIALKETPRAAYYLFMQVLEEPC